MSSPCGEAGSERSRELVGEIEAADQTRRVAGVLESADERHLPFQVRIMADRQTANQAPTRASDELVAAGVLVPFEEVRWTDFPLETRLRALRLILDVIRRRRAEIAAASVVELKAA